MTVADLIAALQALPGAALEAEATIAYFDPVTNEALSDAIGRVVYERGVVELITEGADDN